MRTRCSVEGCEGFVHGHGLCPAHWNRQRRYGDPLGSKPRPVGKRVVLVASGHPLATASRRVKRARLVLFDKLQGKDAPCHWCGLPLRWLVVPIKASPPDSLYADHLNGDTKDDRPENLAPACMVCNVQRHRPGWQRGKQQCSVAGCELPARSKGLCRPHYMHEWKAARRA